MNIQTHKWQMSRRAVLRGLGTTLALPWLEAMSPLARSIASAGDAAPGEIPARLGFLHYNLGMQRLSFFPNETGLKAELSPILKPLEPSRGLFTVFSGTYTEEVMGGHGGEVSFLTGVNPKKGGGFKNTISYDQIAAESIGQATRYPSLTMGQSKGTGFGSNLINTLSWNRAGVPIASESRPQVLFDKLFRPESAEDTSRRIAEQASQRSLLDAVRADATRMAGLIGKNDREKLDEYLGSIRDMELRLERLDQWSKTPRPKVNAPEFSNLGKTAYELNDAVQGKVPFRDYSRLMWDLIALAWQTDSTRIVAYQVRRNSVPAELKSPIKDLHTLTHDGDDLVKLEWWWKTDELYMREFNYFLQKLASIKEGSRTMLDHSLVGYSSEMNGTHSRHELPSVLAGGAAFGIKHQTHVKCPKETLVGNLWETMMVKAKVPLKGHINNSSGLLPEVV